jgi:DNA-directed RNA polymerase specialized sigma24 family protein
MLDVDKEKLNKSFNEGDMTYFFSEAHRITDFVLSRNYKVFDEEKREDMTQECLMNLWKKIQQGKVDGSKNLMSFIWQNSTYRILEIFRKENNRNRIAKFISLDAQEGDYLELECLEA